MNILAIDDHELFRTGLRHLLNGIDEEIVYNGVGSVEEAESLQMDRTLDLILLDYFLPDVGGDSALSRIRVYFPGVVIVVISSLDDPPLIRRAIDLGAAGFIPKSSSQSVLVSALRLILGGGVYLPRHAICSERAARQYPRTAISDESDLCSFSRLTDRQKEVIRGVVKGMANKVIASELCISEGTVKSHLSTAFKTLGVSSRTQAVILLAKNDSIDASY